MYPLDENLEIENDVNTEISSRENKAFYFASFVLLLMTVGLVLALLPEDSLLRAQMAHWQALKPQLCKVSSH